MARARPRLDKKKISKSWSVPIHYLTRLAAHFSYGYFLSFILLTYINPDKYMLGKLLISNNYFRSLNHKVWY